MYNRYIPSENGTYRRQIVEEKRTPPKPDPPPEPKPVPQPKPPKKPAQPSVFSNLDTADLILLLILLLLMLVLFWSGNLKLIVPVHLLLM